MMYEVELLAGEKLFEASVKDRMTKEIQVVRIGAKNATQAKKDLRANGYSVRFIAEPENFDRACDEYYEKLETAKKMRKIMKQYRA